MLSSGFDSPASASLRTTRSHAGCAIILRSTAMAQSTNSLVMTSPPALDQRTVEYYTLTASTVGLPALAISSIVRLTSNIFWTEL